MTDADWLALGQAVDHEGVAGRQALASVQAIAAPESLRRRYYDVDTHLCDDDSHPGFLRYDVAVGLETAAVWVVGQSKRTE